MGNIEKRGKNSWRIGVQVNTENGWEWIRDTLSFPPGMSDARQRKEAKQALARLELDVADGKRRPAPSQHTVRSFAELWMQEYVDTNLAKNTAKSYRHFLDARILPALGDLPLKRLTPLLITRWLNDVRISPRRSTRLPDVDLKANRPPSLEARMANAKPMDLPLSDNTVLHYYTALAAMLDKAVQWEFLAKNPMDKVDRPTMKKVKVKYLTEERAVELLRCLKDEPNLCYRSALLLAMLCGLRLGEVGALRLSDVDFDEGTVDITRALKYTPRSGSYEGSPKTESGNRLIALPAGMMTLLYETREYQAEKAALVGDIWVGEGWIVHAWNGARLHHDTPSKWFRRFADAHGFEGVRFHDLRHTHATILLANNIDAVAVASRLGHRDATTTLQVYAHALRRRDEDAARAAQSLLDRAAGPDQDAAHQPARTDRSALSASAPAQNPSRDPRP